MVEVIPAIIPKDIEDLRSKLFIVEGVTDKVQIDITDGVYAPEMNWPYTESFQGFEEMFENIEPYSSFSIEFDCMVQNPEESLKKIIRGKNRSYIIHIESTDDFQKALNLVKESGNIPALAMKPSTNLNNIEEYLDQISFVQIMGNDKIGFHGVSLDETVYEKISTLHQKYPELIIGVDIGVNFETASRLRDSGASRLVSGSAIFGSDDISGAIEKLQFN